MAKRKAESLLDYAGLAKKHRTHKIFFADKLSSLSDELVLRIFSFLSVSNLVACERISRRLRALAVDSQLWKAVYYDRFVRPRASKIPGIRGSNASFYYSSRRSRWLEDEHLVRSGVTTDWKKQYKLRHNWTIGSCRAVRIEVDDEESEKCSVLVQLAGDTAITVDAVHGIRAWSIQNCQQLLASLPFQDQCETDSGVERLMPTALSLAILGTSPSRLAIAVGFESSGYSVFSLFDRRVILTQYVHPPSKNGAIKAIAMEVPFLATMSSNQHLSLYRFQSCSTGQSDGAMKIAQPCLISSLGSHTTWPPLSLALRISPSGLTATVAFSLPTLAGGWTVGIQEVRVANDGEVVQSRLAFADEVGFHPFQDDRTAISNISTLSIPPEPQSRRILKSSPTSLSYSHPYLLLSHSDNTLTLYLASSSDNELAITSGIRLWGHTSSVSGAQVGDRGRAVSVSAIGDEIRVWELEGKVFGQGNKPKQPARLASVQVRPGNENTVEETMESSNVAKGFHIGDPSLDLTKSCVGFDRERIVVLKEDMNGFQTLITYDFT